MIALPRLSSAPAQLPRMVICAGVHAGASLSIDQPHWQVGSGDDCDVILSDAAVAPRHFGIRMGKHSAVTIEATGGAIMVNDVPVPHGSGYDGRLPVRIHVGDAIIALEIDTPVGSLAARRARFTGWFNRHAAVAGGSVVVLCLVLYPFFGMSEADASAPATVAAQPQEPVRTAEAAATQSESPEQALHARLQNAGLGDLKMDAQGSYLQVSGEVDVRGMEQWRGVQRWFDEAYGRTHLLHGAVRLREVLSPPRVRFQAIWTGDNPYVVGERGQRLYPGAAVAGGWVLKGIEPERVILARDGQEFSLTL